MPDLSHLHPATVHFPIAFLLLGIVVEVMSFVRPHQPFYRESSLYLLLLGTLGAVIAYFTGEFVTEDLFGSAGEIRDTHQIWAAITMFSGLITSGLYLFYMSENRSNQPLRLTILILYSLTVVALLVTGYYGGLLGHGEI